MSVETVRPAGAGHETLYVLLGSVLILALAATVVGLRQQSHEAQALDAHQVDARLDLNAAEQGIYADLQVAAEDIQARLDDGEAAPSVDELAAEGFPPFVADVAASSRGEHRWSYGETAGRPSYLGVSGKPEVAAASASACCWPRAWYRRRNCWCWTNRCRPSTRAASRSSSGCCWTGARPASPCSGSSTTWRPSAASPTGSAVSTATCCSTVRRPAA
ncbi:hypothetical protein M770_16530 [Pseudomonas aeruginosa VRFPA03]|nr:hypothetical protein M770_16530 [Pseudomonas aeruginosa VRFPA03]